MPARRKGAVRPRHGVMCNICGTNCGKGGALKKQIERAHLINYEEYLKCYYGKVKTIIADSWDDSIRTANGRTVITHVLVRWFICEPGKRGVPRAARVRR
jgi:hypothetical protein